MSGNDRMELDDLLEREGLDAAGAEQTLAWARARAQELLGGVQGDPELGPLLDGAAVVASSGSAVSLPRPSVLAPAVLAPAVVAPASAARPVEATPAVEVDGASAAGDEPDDDDATLDRVAAGTDEVDATAPQAGASDELDPYATASAEASPSLELAEPSSMAVPTNVVDEPSFGISSAQAELDAAQAELEAAQAELAAAEAGAVPDAAPVATTGSVPLDPLAGIDFDDLPGMDDEDDDGSASSVASDRAADPDEGADGPDATMPSMTAAAVLDDEASMSTDGLPRVDVTQRSANPLDEAPEDVAAKSGDDASDESGSDESESESESESDDDDDEIEEFELLDEDDLVLVEEVAAAPPPAPASESDADGELPEWRAALVSAQLGGGAKADQDSGLLRPPVAPPDAES